MEGWGISILLTTIDRLILALALLLTCFVSNIVQAEENKEKSFMEQPLVQPNVVRRKIDKVAIDNENLEMGFYAGLYAIDGFGTNQSTGIRVAYHMTEDIFIEGTMGQTTLSKPIADEAFQLNIVGDDQLESTHYDVSVGYNILPGEVFIGETWAFNFAFYLMAGIGSTEFLDERQATVVSGFGMRVLGTDWMALHFDVRDHVFRQKYLNVEKTTHNIEMIFSTTFFF